MKETDLYSEIAEETAFEVENEGRPNSLFGYDSYYFNDGSHGEYFRKIAHLVEYTDLVLLVSGPRGVGKTRFLKQRFVHDHKANWRSCVLNAKYIKTTQQALDRITEALGLPSFSPDDPDSANKFVQTLDEFRQQQFLIVIAVDNAHAIKREVAELLSQLAHIEDSSTPLIKLVLASEQLPGHLQKIFANDQNSNNSLKELPLPRIGFEDFSHYLDDLLNQAGHLGQSPFNIKTRQKIYQASNGLFNNLNQLVDKEWQQYTHRSGSFQMLNMNSSGFKYAAVTLGVSIIVSALAFTVFTETGMEEDNAHRVTQAIPIPNRAQQGDGNSAIGESGKSTVLANINTAKNPAGPTDTLKSDGIVKRAPENKQLAQTPNVGTPENKVSGGNIAQKREKKSADNQWLAQINGEHYTLQLLGGRNKSAISEFVKLNRIGQNSRMIETQRNGQSWYTLFYGDYKDKNEATIASKDVQKSLPSVKPWIRSYASIQKTMAESDKSKLNLTPGQAFAGQ